MIMEYINRVASIRAFSSYPGAFYPVLGYSAFTIINEIFFL